MQKEVFGKIGDEEIYKYTIKDSENNSISILNYGAIIQSLIIKNKNGEFIDTVLGYDDIDSYVKCDMYIGAICGRVANRIEDARYSINDKEYTLTKNNHNAASHGGLAGFNKRIFKLIQEGEDFIILQIFSENGDGGFNANLTLNVKYTFKNALLLIEYFALCDEKSPVNITSHSYFNLNGKGNIKNHSLKLNSSFYMPVRDDGVTTGEVLSVKNTDFDFLKYTKLEQRILNLEKKQPSVKGIDHHFFQDFKTTDYRYMASLKNEDETLCLDVFCDVGGVQIYTGNYISDVKAKNRFLEKNAGIAIEPQYPPNNLKYSHLENMLLEKGKEYYKKTGYKFYY